MGLTREQPYTARQEISATPYEVLFTEQKDSRWLVSIFFVYLLLGSGYIVLRTLLINWDIWYGPLLYLAELYGFVATSLFLFFARNVRTPNHRNLDNKRIVDVLIPTYNEPLSIIGPVITAAMEILGVRRVLVLDDGNRSEVRDFVNDVGSLYIPRLTNEHAKAGNLNNGLKYTDAEFIALFDADHIPQANFITQTLGFFDDKQLAIVQTPQSFYNTSSFLFRKRLGKQDGWSEQLMFYNCIQPAKNRWNSAFFVGTSAVLRRSAIDSIGGFATGTATEDIHTSLRLHAKGWKSIFLPEPLAYGLESENLKEFYKQRRRWAAGSLGLLFRSRDSPLWARGLSFMQRLNYVSATLAHLQGVQKLCFFVVPILTVVWGISPITSRLSSYVIFFLLFYFASIAATWLHSRGTYHLFYNEAYALANMMAHFGGIKGVVKVQKKFAVSRKVQLRKERSWVGRFLWILFWLGIAGIVRTLWLYIFEGKHGGLIMYSFIFMIINSATLLWFLLHLRSYERSEIAPESVRVLGPRVNQAYFSFRG